MKRKCLAVMALITALSLLLLASPVFAGDVNNGQQKLEEKLKMNAARLKAAANLKAAKAGIQATLGTVSAATIIDPSTGIMVPDYFGAANWAFSPPLNKFVDKVAGLGPAGANALGQYIPIAVPDTTTYPGSDYYEIAVVEFQVQMHSSLPATRQRGYVQLSTANVPGAMIALLNPDGSPITMPDGSQAFAVDNPHFLGPAIVANGTTGGTSGVGTPVRIKFYNLLPSGTGGNLFVPRDRSVMGAGMFEIADPNNPGATIMGMFSDNRATVHLHGNDTVWISDGTPHQWITPATENTPYPKGVSVVDIPDMPPAGKGAMTVFYSNAQSARLMFYHDHAYGITRLNVYVGEAAAYVITDQVEQDLINGTNNSGVNPGLLKVLPDIGIPLVIQDRTFVDPATIGATDPTWLDPLQESYGTSPGTAVLGDLWYPHVYMPAQNPYDLSGMNAYGRWMYGPWFYPPTVGLIQGAVANPYYDPLNAPWEPPLMPGTPVPSTPAEAFMDTPMVNGTVFPYLEVEPKAYRFRILNAGDDRFLNLSMYKATAIVGSIALVDPGSGYTAEPNVTITPAAGDTTGHGAQAFATIDPLLGTVTAVTITVVGSNYTAAPIITIDPPAAGTQATATASLFTTNASGFGSEVGMVPVTGTAWLPPFDVSGVPDQANAGPDWIQIGTEGGFLPAPAVIPAGPITWNTNPTNFNFGNVNGHSLALGTAERADVIVDFSAFAGQTLILYNDAPAAWPAPDPRYDYYTNDQDQTMMGGAPTTPPGVGPNTRTIMQIRVGTTVSTPVPDVTLANLQSAWAKSAATGKRGVFEVSQDPIITPQAAYSSAYDNTFTSIPAEEYIQVNQYTKTFQPIDANGALQPTVTLPLQPKATHDEMGGVYDRYGRMSGMLGLELPASTSRLAQFIAYGYASPPVDIFGGSTSGTLVGSLGDGTQIWNISQNGVDTHTIHTHLFNFQLINRVAWDGGLIPPDPNELGWKETLRVNPLEQTFIALRPILPTAAQIPFIDKVPNSVRLIDVTAPAGAPLDPPPPAGWFDPNGVAIASILNHKVNFGWEYVYHCHILAHEENDMMHATSFVVPPVAPTNLSAAMTGSGNKTAVVLSWTGAVNATSYAVQRATSTTGPWTTIATATAPTYTDPVGNTKLTYFYRVSASNTVGDALTPGFTTRTASSGFSNLTAYPIGTPVVPPADPTNVAASAALQGASNDRVTVSWTGSTDAQQYLIRIATDPAFTSIIATGTVAAPTVTFTSGNLPLLSYYVGVQATNAAGASALVNATPFPVLAP